MAHEKASSANVSPAVIQAAQILQALGAHPDNEMNQIGRASCRERV